jgi:hypothetical protein
MNNGTDSAGTVNRRVTVRLCWTAAYKLEYSWALQAQEFDVDHLAVVVDLSESTGNKIKLLRNGSDLGMPDSDLSVEGPPQKGFAFSSSVVCILADPIDDLRVWNYAKTSFEDRFRGDGTAILDLQNYPSAGATISDPTPTFEWGIPAKENSVFDFRLEISSDENFETLQYVYESRKDPSAFSPMPPRRQSGGKQFYTMTKAMPNDTWYWRVWFWDGKGYNVRSIPKSFTLSQ